MTDLERTDGLTFEEAMKSNAFLSHPSKLAFILGTDDAQNLIIEDLDLVSHIAIAGSSGTGKSCLVHSIILSLMSRSTPNDLRFILCDTKMLEFSAYKGSPYLLIPPVLNSSKAAVSLQWASAELDQRLRLFSENTCKSISSYNNKYPSATLSHIVIVLDDAAAIVDAFDSQGYISNIAQNGRSVGMHLILVSQTPNHRGISSIIKSLIPTHIAFSLPSKNDQIVMLGSPMEESSLLDVGVAFLRGAFSPSKRKLICCQLSDDIIEDLISSASQDLPPDFYSSTSYASHDPLGSDEDEMLPAAVDVILETKQASVSMLQRRLKLGYARAARIIDEMEEKGIVGPFAGSAPRQILITKARWEQLRSEHLSAHEPDIIVETDVKDIPIVSEENIVAESQTTSPEDSNYKDPSQCDDISCEYLPSESCAPKNRPRRKYRLGAILKEDNFPKPVWVKILTGFTFLCGALCILNFFISAELPTFDRAFYLIFGLFLCVVSLVSVIRWILVSLLALLTGFASFPMVYSKADGFDLAGFLTVALFFVIAIIYGSKVRKRFIARGITGSSQNTMTEIDCMSGLEFEEFTAQLLRRLGYNNVVTTKASGDQGIDVLAQKDGVSYAIQCKNYSRKLDNTPVQEAYAGKAFYDCDVAVVITNSTFTPGAYELASSVGVLLWDRDVLQSMIYDAL